MANKPEDNRHTQQLKYLEDVILREYDFRSIKRVKGQERVWRVSTDKGDRFLKLARCNSTELSFVRQVLEHIANRGFRRVARFIVTKYGDPFVEDQGSCYYLTDWIEGKTCSFNKPVYLEEAVYTLAEFHRASIGFESKPPRQEWGKWKRIFSERAEKIQNLSRNWEKGNPKDSPVGKLINGKAAAIYAWAMQASRLFESEGIQSLLDSEKAERVISHGRFTESNIIIGKDGRGAYVVDLDHCLQDARIFDLAKLLAKVLPRNNWNVDLSLRILAWYSDIRPVSENEFKAIIAYLAFPHRMYRYFRLGSIEELTTKDARLAERFQEDYLLEDSRKQFLHQLVLRKNLDLNMEI
ncbi:MAG TPA: CotS family spore coat protein [Bacillota bacterium]|nr:CotS family spore coat protein [Bacillota bacterium]